MMYKYIVGKELRFKEWFAANEKTAGRSLSRSMRDIEPQVGRELNEVARRSLWRTLTKWGAGQPEGRAKKPVAILTAFRGDYTLAVNRQRNRALLQDLAASGLSHYPVKGEGQERQRFFLAFKLIVPTTEESFVVHP
ncbi:MAG: hypothetical protein WD403_15425, partial [Pirellulales bacterium]